jgi:hypothetical protein
VDTARLTSLLTRLQSEPAGPSFDDRRRDAARIISLQDTTHCPLTWGWLACSSGDPAHVLADVHWRFAAIWRLGLPLPLLTDVFSAPTHCSNGCATVPDIYGHHFFSCVQFHGGPRSSELHDPVVVLHKAWLEATGCACSFEDQRMVSRSARRPGDLIIRGLIDWLREEHGGKAAVYDFAVPHPGCATYHPRAAFEQGFAAAAKSQSKWDLYLPIRNRIPEPHRFFAMVIDSYCQATPRYHYQIRMAARQIVDRRHGPRGDAAAEAKAEARQFYMDLSCHMQRFLFAFTMACRKKCC